MSSSEASAVAVCLEDELPPGEVRVVEGTPRIAVFNDGGELFAIDDRCSHQEARLSEGFAEDGLVECPLHATCFDLRTGWPTGPPATVPVRTYRVEVVDGRVQVQTTPQPVPPVGTQSP